MDILLTHANHLFFDRKQVRKMQPYPPLQTLLVAAVLRGRGFEVELFDSTFAPPEAGFAAALERGRPRMVAVCEDNFNFLTKMCLTRNRELAFDFARMARARGIPAVVNSSDSADHADAYLDTGFDFVAVGEIEATLEELSGRLLRGAGPRLEEIAGLVYRDGASDRRATGSRPLLEDLNTLPSPAWDLVDLEAYRRVWTEAHGYFSLNLVASRGCPYHCNWCAKPIYGQSYHAASPERVARELAELKAACGPDQIWFADDIFALSPSWTRAFADEVERLEARVPFKMQSRCDLMTRDTVAALRRAGCMEVWMGAESGAQEILDAMDKGVRVQQIYDARENLRRHDIRACFFLQFGYPGETWDGVQRTIRMVRETDPDDIGISVAYPLPGTRFYDRVARELGVKTNWSDSDDLAMIFRGRYGSDFYRTLRDALHLELDLRRGRTASGGQDDLDALWSRLETLSREKESEVRSQESESILNSSPDSRLLTPDS